MSILKVILYSTQDSKSLIYIDTDGVMTSEIERVYTKECDIACLRTGGARIKVSEKTRDTLLALEQKYDQSTKFHIRKLRGFISKLKDGECFYYFNKDKASIVERRTAINCLKLEANGIPLCERLHNAIFEHYSIPNLKYQYLSFGYDGLEEWVGEEDVQKRVCRFCGKSVPDVKFDKSAHAIQDALGNKLLFCYEECDTCNHDLASVEDHFRIIMDFRRSIFRIPRKETTKAADVVGKDFIIQADSNGDPHLYLMQENLRDVDTSKPFIQHFELKQPIVNEQMYKALCKMVIDLLPASELSHFENTIRWIKSKDFAPDSLPSIWLGNLSTDTAVYKQPMLDIFINNRNLKQQAPYCTAIIWIYDIAYLFVMPLVDVDAGQYKYDNQLAAHLELMKEWAGLEHWQQQDTGNYRLSIPWVNWLVDVSLKNVHILSETDPVFGKCQNIRKNVQGIQMPDVLPEDLSMVNIEKIEFKSFYNGPICDKDLMDITLHVTEPLYVLNLEKSQIKVVLTIEANDTTDKVAYFKEVFAVNIHVNRFCEFVLFEDNDSETTFVFHYQLRDFLFDYALTMVEHEMLKLRKGSQFEKCTLERISELRERLIEGSVYIIPFDNKKYMRIPDSMIHGIAYD